MNFFSFDKKEECVSGIPIFIKILLTMKIATFLLLFVTVVHAESKAQKVSLSFKNASLEQVLAEISAQTNYRFLYSDELVKKVGNVFVELKDGSIEKALDMVLKNLTYRIISETVIISKKEDEAAAVLSASEKARQRTVNGTIRDESGEVLPGVSVSVKGISRFATTNAGGVYNIQASEGDILVFKSLGFKPQEIKVGSTTTINVTMDEDQNMLQEVQVVSTGYQTIDKKLFTGAATNVRGSDVKMEGLTDVSRMLEGRVAGVSVQNVSGTFGTAPRIRVRGATSISGENKPLWVVDGVVLEDVVNVSNDQLASGDPMTLIGSSVAGINAEDIESFEILKDASATALYGARAMNGVVVITTKKGRVGQPVVTYTGNYSTYLKPDYSTYNIMNSNDQMSVYLEMSRKGLLNLAPSLRSSNGGVFTKMFQLIDTFNPETGSFMLENTPEARGQFLERYAQANTDWFDILFNNSFVHEHSLSISSGTETAQHYFSGSFYNDNGWTIADNVKRYTANMRSNYKLSDKITAGVIMTGSVRDQRTPGSQARINDVVRGDYTRDFDINPFSYALNTSRVLTAYDENGDLEYFTRNYAPFNIINEVENNYIDLNVLDFKLQGEVGYKFLKNFEYNVLGAMRYVKTTRENMITEYSNMAEAYRADYNSTIRSNNNFLYNNPDFPGQERQSVLPEGGFYMRNDDILRNWYGRHTVNYNQTFNEKHTVNVFAGQEIRYADRQNAYNNGYGYQYDKGGVPFTDFRIIKQMLEGNFDYFGMSYGYDRFISMFANASYAFNEKYIINGTIRYDGSNRMGSSSQARWLPTWTLSGAWNIDEEAFMQNVNTIDFLKLRGTYGLTASMGNASNSTVVLENTSTLRPYLIESEPKIVISSLENSELTWEKQYEANVGVDLGLWKNKLTLTVDLYKRNGFDLINTVRTSGVGGQVTKTANYADMISRGFEVTLGNQIIKVGDWDYRTNFTLGYNVNEITNLLSQPRIFDLIIPEGGPKEGGAVRGLYSVAFSHLDPSTGIPVFVNESGNIGRDVNLQSTNTANLIYEGPVDPTLTGGFSNMIRYKGLSLNVFFTYQAGNKIRLDRAFKTSYSDLDAMPREFLDRWTMPGDELITNIPSIADPQNQLSLGSVYPYNTYNYSNTRVVDGSFVRLKTLALNYALPSALVRAWGLNSASLALNATNLFLIYADPDLKGQDPEFFNSGGVALPMPQQFTLTLRVGI